MGALIAIAMTWFADAPLWSAAGALIVVYGGGYIVGSLLVDRVDGVSLALIRTIAGLLLTTVAFLLSLTLSLPWFLLPVALVTAAVWFHRRRALAWPQAVIGFQRDGVLAAILALTILSPILVTAFYMAPGRFPPVFYNIDTVYSLEKVHALVAADTYPPESLSNVGVRRTYHYGTQAMAAMVSRGSGLRPHQSLFLIVIPLLTAGVIAAAVAVARHLGPGVPRSVSVPLLLISMPSPANPFWHRFSFDRIGDYGLWGILSNEAQNVGGDFLVLASVAGIAAAWSWGWRLPAFLIGAAILVKTPAGIALLAGFALAEAWQGLTAKRFSPSPQLLMTGAVFVVIFVAFFVVSFESIFRVELAPLFHLRQIARSGSLHGLALDLLWVFLPVAIVLTARIPDPERRSAPILLLALGPLLIANLTRINNTGEGGGGAGDEWLQILHPVPFLLHAFALSLASRRWVGLGRPRRAAFVLAMAVAIAPVALAASGYARLLLRTPTRGNDFVDNRSLAEALAVIPTNGTIIVTNDLRYPAQNFARDDRQMQIPALFGHQAFAVNYAYEPVEDRRPLQQLLQQPVWSGAILEAARTHRWTHFLVRKDYVHPALIPLERIFENSSYAVFRFS